MDWILKPLFEMFALFLRGITGPLTFILLALLGWIVAELFSAIFINIIGKILTDPTPLVFAKPTNGASPTQYIIEHLAWYTAFALIVSIMVCGMRMMFSKNSYYNFHQFIKGVFIYAISSITIAQIVILAIEAGDEFSAWIVNDSGQISGLVHIGPDSLSDMLSFEGNISTILNIVIALIGFILAIFEWIIMYARAGILGILIALLPLAGALSITQTGYNYFRKIIGWIIAFVLYKPLCAIIFAYCKQMLQITGNDKAELVATLTLGMCLLTLPTTIQLLSPFQSFPSSGSNIGMTVLSSAAGYAAGGALLGGAKAAEGAAAKEAGGGAAHAGGGADGALNVAEGSGGGGGSIPSGGGGGGGLGKGGGGGPSPSGGGPSPSGGGPSPSGGGPSPSGGGGYGSFGGGGAIPSGGGGNNQSNQNSLNETDTLPTNSHQTTSNDTTAADYSHASASGGNQNKNFSEIEDAYNPLL